MHQILSFCQISGRWIRAGFALGDFLATPFCHLVCRIVRYAPFFTDKSSSLRNQNSLNLFFRTLFKWKSRALRAKKAWRRRRVSLICRNFAALESLSNPQKITCIIFENLFGPYFLPHQSHSYGYAPSSGENLTSKMSFKSDATYYFHITKSPVEPRKFS